MEPNNLQAQSLYRICYRLTNKLYPGWPYKSIDLVRVDERTGVLFVIADEETTYEIDQLGEIS